MKTTLLDQYGGAVPRYTSYPTAPHFHDGVSGSDYRRWLSDIPESESLSLYFHVPFCARMCWYCGCHTKIVSRYEPISEYVSLLSAETFLWPVGLVDKIGTLTYRIVWWGFGHLSQQIKMTAMVTAWHAVAALTVGAKSISEKVNRAAFFLYIYFLLLAPALSIAHHNQCRFPRITITISSRCQ